MNFAILGLMATVAVGAPPSMESTGWRIQATQDPITDVVQAAAQKLGKGVKITLWCESDTPTDVRAEINFDEYLGSDDHNKVTYRVDDGVPVSTEWHYTSPGRGTTVFPTSFVVPVFIAEISKGHKLAVQAATYDSKARDVVRVIDIDGVAEILGKLRQTCAENHREG